MKYADYEKLDAYPAAQPGAAIRIVVYKASDPSTKLIGRQTGINWDDQYETLPVEEAGNDGVDEHATGRHTGSLTTNGFFSAEKNDVLPTRQNFLGAGDGEEYVLMQVLTTGRVGEDIPLNVFEGCKCSRHNSGQGARGLITFDLAFSYTRRYNGKEWAALSGN